MCRTRCVLALVTLCVELVHSFSWDVAVSRDNCLEFYKNGTLTHSEAIPSAYIPMLTYDPVHNRVLFLDQRNESTSACSFDLATKKVQTHYVRKPFQYVQSISYDPITDLLYWVNGRDLYSLSLKPESEQKGFGTRLTEIKYEFSRDIAVDSCRGFIYWISQRQSINRARLNGTDREIVFNDKINWLYGLTIDQQTQKLYWIANDLNNDVYTMTIVCADLKGNNIKKLYETKTEWLFTILDVSKDSIYWGTWLSISFFQIPKNPPHDIKPKEIFNKRHMDITTNYKIKDQIHGIKDCKALKSLLPINPEVNPLNVTTDASLLCVHGTKVSGKSVCACAQGYTGERCDVSICQNYCFQGACSVSADQPKCRCNDGYSGERCEVNMCQGYCLNNGVCALNKTNEPVCQCAGGYGGDRCEVSVCQNYCFQGYCSVSAEDRPICRCDAGYSGERCEVEGCQGYCLNNGICALNIANEPVCQCTGEYEGERCEFPVFLTKCFRTVSMLKDILNTDVTWIPLGKESDSTCASTVV